MKRRPQFGDVLNYLVSVGPAPRRQRGEIVHVASLDVVVVRNVLDLSRVCVVTRTARVWHLSVSTEPSSLEAAIGAAVLISGGAS